MSHREKQINVQKSNYNVVDNEFSSMKERFEQEMRRVEDEMARLRREFEGYTPKMNQNGTHAANGPAPQQAIQYQQQQRGSLSRSTYQSSSGYPSPGSAYQQNGPSQVANRPRYDPYLDNIKSPLIRDESDGKSLRLRFNVNQYRPEEVTVKTVDNRLLVHAKHEEKSPQRTVYREYNQEFMLPRGTNPELITSSLSVDGVLTVEAPLPAIEGGPGQHHRIPITHR